MSNGFNKIAPKAGRVIGNRVPSGNQLLSTSGGGGGGGFLGSLLAGGGAALFGAGTLSTGGALLIPALIGIGLEFFTSRRASKNIKSMAEGWMSDAIMRESKYTTGSKDWMGIEPWLKQQQSRMDALNQVLYTTGVPKNPTYEKIFGEEKGYGFESETTPSRGGSSPRGPSR